VGASPDLFKVDATTLHVALAEDGQVMVTAVPVVCDDSGIAKADRRGRGHADIRICPRAPHRAGAAVIRPTGRRHRIHCMTTPSSDRIGTWPLLGPS